MYYLLLTLTIIAGLGYVFLITMFTIGWQRIVPFRLNKKKDQQQSSKTVNAISVIVPCKNEEKRLSVLLSCLEKQTCSDFEVILIDDQSIDATYQLMQDWNVTNCNKKVLQTTSGSGKKKALEEGIHEATGKLIITVDADCMPGPKWIETIDAFQSENQCDMIIGPVMYKEVDDRFSHIQTFEFVSLVASGAGAAGINNPILCNGANLAFRKEIWKQSGNDLHHELLSGDDVFLLQSIKKKKGKIRFLKSTDAMVYTLPVESLQTFIRQRKRWASKSGAYSDPFLIFTACMVFGISFGLVILLVFACFDSVFLLLYSILFVVKLITDMVLFNSVKLFFNLRHVFINTLLISLLYPFYITFTGISAFVFRRKEW